MRQARTLLALMATSLIPIIGATPSSARQLQATAIPHVADFNGDGFGDLAIGVPSETVGNKDLAGVVQVVYGTTSGLQGSDPDDQLITQDSPGVEDQVEGADFFGSSLAAADFDGDGFTDLSVGVDGEEIDSVFRAGAVQVFYGSTGGLDTVDDQFISQGTSDVEDSPENQDYFGRLQTAGDYNRDGYADLAVGVFYEDVATAYDAGAVHVFYGSSQGLQAAAPDDQFISQDSADVEDHSERLDGFGQALTSGDFNGDGYADLAVDVFNESVRGPFSYESAVQVLYGSGSGLQAVDPNDQLITQDSPGVRDVGESGDLFGDAVSAGDFNADGYSDLAVGVPDEDLGELDANFGAGEGVVQILYGSANGLQATSPDDQLLSQATPGVKGTARRTNNFGWPLLSSDLNADGFADLVVGIYLEDANGSRDAGAVEILYGSRFGLQQFQPDDQFLAQGTPGIRGESEDLDYFGIALSAADFNGDGSNDLAVGVPNEDFRGLTDAGTVHVFYSSASGIQTRDPDDQLLTQDSPWIKERAENQDSFGGILTAGS